MLDELFDTLISALPGRVQLGCLVIFVVLVLAAVAWVYWPEAW